MYHTTALTPNKYVEIISMHLTYQGLLLYHTVLRQVHSPWHWHDNRYVSKYSGFALLTLVNVPFKYELVGKLYQGTLVIL